jgi:hypothetical protein
MASAPRRSPNEKQPLARSFTAGLCVGVLFAAVAALACVP